MSTNIVTIVLFLTTAFSSQAQKQLTKYVNPLIGTASLRDSIHIGYKPIPRK